MARKHKHEEHANHEAWAIPYGDLVTLLLAFFVVMYALSTINEGKFRVLSDSLQAAFRGAPRTLEPVNVGEKSRGSGADIAVSIVQQATLNGQPRQMLEAITVDTQLATGGRRNTDKLDPDGKVIVPPALGRVADEIEKALAPLVAADMIAVRRHSTWVEVEIRTDILFASGVAKLSDAALPALTILAETLAKYPNPVRVEGHTDNRRSARPRSRRTGSCPRRAPRASCTCSRGEAWIRRGWPSSGSVNSVPRKAMPRRGAQREPSRADRHPRRRPGARRRIR